MKKTIALILLGILMLTWIPSADAATSDYTLQIRGGETSQSMAKVNGESVLKVDVYLNGITDNRLLTALDFELGFNTSQLEYVTDSQSLGSESLYAVNASGNSMGSRQLVINTKNAKKGKLRVVFATDYGCRINSGEPLISFYFYFGSEIAVGSKIAFTLGKTVEAESVKMSAQTGNATYTQRSVGKSFTSYTVSQSSVTVVDGEIVFNSADVQYKGTTPYVVYSGKAQKPRVTVRNKNTNKTVASKYYTLTYSNNTNAGTATVEVLFRRGYIGTCSKTFKIYLPATTATYVENRSDGIYIRWNKVSGAKGYVIYRRAWNLQSSGWTTFERWYNVTGTSWVDGSDTSHSVYAGTRYQYGVKAYPYDPLDNYNLGLVGPLKTTVRITTRNLTKVTAGSKQMTIKWEGSKNFTGYQIQYATDADFTQNAKDFKIANPDTTETTVKSLTSGTTYYIRIRSYHIFEGMNYYGEWSNVLSCKVK